VALKDAIVRNPLQVPLPDLHQAFRALVMARRFTSDAEVAAETSVFLPDLFSDQSVGRRANLVCVVKQDDGNGREQ